MTTPADQLRAAIRAIHALKSPPPDGSQHYQAGWDTGLEAAIEAVQGVFEQPPARLVLGTTDQQPATTADKAAALGMAPTDYRTYLHDAAVEQIREAVGGLFATTGQRVMDALDGTTTGQLTPCGPVPDACDAEAGDPCANHEREQAHAEGEHAFCGDECTTTGQPETAPVDRAEAHRLAVSEALGLGTGAPWDAIRDRAAELHRAPVDRAAVHVAAERDCLAMAVMFARQWKPDAPMSLRDGIDEILATMPSRMADEAQQPDVAEARCARCRELIDHRGTESAPLWVHRFGNQYCYPGLRASARPDRTPAS